MDRLELLIPPPVITLVTGLIMWMLARMFPAWTVLIRYRLLIAVLLVLSGVLLGLAALGLFVRAQTTADPRKPAKASRLVQSGVYRYSRNPMYLGLLIALAGWGLYLGSLPGMLCLIAFVAAMNRLQIIPEERILAQRFGSEFADYKSKVGRWV